jgi:hypothetical protein
MSKMIIRKFRKEVLITLIALAIGVLFLFIPRILSTYPDLSEKYSATLFPVLSRPVTFITSLCPISLTEILVLFASLTALLWLFLLILRFKNSDDRKRTAIRSVTVLSVVFAVLSMSFTLMLGIQYTRVPLENSLKLDASQKSAEDLKEVSLWLAQNIQRTRALLPEDENGCMVLTTDMKETLAEASISMDAAARLFPELAGPDLIAKPVALSHLWSYTGITGMYFPFLGEANVNTDIPPSQLPITICHEISHTRGIAREQDANLAGFLACLNSSRIDYQYCAYQYAYLYCCNDLYRQDQNAYMEVSEWIPEGTWRDWQQSSEYWKQFEGPVQETSTAVNDTYLEANQQAEGVLSYDRVTDLKIDYYFTYVKGQ